MYNNMQSAARNAMDILLDDDSLATFRRRLRCKVRHHLGAVCPDVEDLVQETLVRLLNVAKENGIRNPTNLGGFLNGVCNNVISEYRRRLWREEPYDPESRDERRGDQPSDVELLELREAVADGLAQLSHRDHHILRSFYLEEKTPQEICRDLGLTDAQFRVALFRAKQRFRKIYRDTLK